MKKLILYTLLIWPFIWENARQSYHNAQLIHLPPTFLRFTEAGLIIVFLFYILGHNKYLRKDFALPIVAITIIGMISGLFNGSEFQGTFEVTYRLIRPFLVLFIVMNLNLDDKFLSKAFKILLAIAIVNAGVHWFQYIASGRSGDSAGGLMFQAHTFSNYMYIVTFFCLAYIHIKKKYYLLPLLLFFIIPTYIAAHEKTVVLSIGVFGLFFWIVSKGNICRRAIVFALVLLLFLFGMYQLTAFLRPQTIKLVTLYARNIPRLGLVEGYLCILRIFVMYPQYALCGLGPGRYGSVYATVGRYTESIERSKWGEVAYESFHVKKGPALGGRPFIGARSNQIVAVLSEYGFIGFIVWGLALAKLGKFLFSAYYSSPTSDVRWLSLGSILGIFFIIAIAFVHLTSGYTVQSNIFPLMIIAGLLYGTLYRANRKE